MSLLTSSIILIPIFLLKCLPYHHNTCICSTNILKNKHLNATILKRAIKFPGYNYYIMESLQSYNKQRIKKKKNTGKQPVKKTNIAINPWGFLEKNNNNTRLNVCVLHTLSCFKICCRHSGSILYFLYPLSLLNIFLFHNLISSDAHVWKVFSLEPFL